MNNYCTNCGNKLQKKDLVCSKCNVPIIDLPLDYKYASPKKKIIKKIIIITLLSCIFLIVLMVIGHKIRVNILKEKYVEKYIKDNYPNQEYTIEYNTSGKCIIAGDCYINNNCAHSCEEYTYLNRFKCRSYFYNVTIGEKEYEINVFRKDGKYSVVEGKNIYGSNVKIEDYDEDNMLKEEINKPNKENNELDDYGEDKETINDEKDNNNIMIYEEIKQYPYESNYYSFNNGTTNNILKFDDNNELHFFTGMLSTNKKIYITGHIYNKNYNKGNIVMNTKFYDHNYNELGNCNDNIKLLGEGYSNVSYACHIPENELKTNSNISDIKYYNIYIDEYNKNTDEVSYE